MSSSSSTSKTATGSASSSAASLVAFKRHSLLSAVFSLKSAPLAPIETLETVSGDFSIQNKGFCTLFDINAANPPRPSPTILAHSIAESTPSFIDFSPIECLAPSTSNSSSPSSKRSAADLQPLGCFTNSSSNSSSSSLDLRCERDIIAPSYLFTEERRVEFLRSSVAFEEVAPAAPAWEPSGSVDESPIPTQYRSRFSQSTYIRQIQLQDEIDGNEDFKPSESYVKRRLHPIATNATDSDSTPSSSDDESSSPTSTSDESNTISTSVSAHTSASSLYDPCDDDPFADANECEQVLFGLEALHEAEEEFSDFFRQVWREREERLSDFQYQKGEGWGRSLTVEDWEYAGRLQRIVEEVEA